MRQKTNKKSEVLRLTREMPKQLAVALAVHQGTCSKELVTMLNWIQQASQSRSKIKASVLRQMQCNDGMYFPSDVVKGRHVFLPWTVWISRKTYTMCSGCFTKKLWWFTKRLSPEMQNLNYVNFGVLTCFNITAWAMNRLAHRWAKQTHL